MSTVGIEYRRLMSHGPRRAWERLLLLLLAPLGILYGLIGAARVLAYRCGIFSVRRAGVPVVSVGNLSVGGTGKTPVVDYIVKFYLSQGKKVAVVSRGYGGRIRKGVGIVSRGSGPLLTADQCGDEPYLLSRRNPSAFVLVARRRAEGVRCAEKELGAEVIVLDDGFQHLAVARDLDIVLLDARRPFANGRVLPAGLLREFPSALNRGDLFILTRWEEGAPDLPQIHGPLLRSRHLLGDRAVSISGEEIPFSSLQGMTGAAFAGVADPASFFRDLRAAGLTIRKEIAFPDHAVYGPDELEHIASLSSEIDYLVTTEKDGVKIGKHFSPIPCYQIPLKLAFVEEGELEHRLKALRAG